MAWSVGRGRLSVLRAMLQGSSVAQHLRQKMRPTAKVGWSRAGSTAVVEEISSEEVRHGVQRAACSLAAPVAAPEGLVDKVAAVLSENYFGKFIGAALMLRNRLRRLSQKKRQKAKCPRSPLQRPGAAIQAVIFMLIYADDENVLSGGADRWLNLWMSLALLCLQGTPFSERKWRGGLQLDWVGYGRVKLGISEKRCRWIISGIESMEENGWLVDVRRFHEFHGRLGFMSQVLVWIRPFLTSWLLVTLGWLLCGRDRSSYLIRCVLRFIADRLRHGARTYESAEVLALLAALHLLRRDFKELWSVPGHFRASFCGGTDNKSAEALSCKLLTTRVPLMFVVMEFVTFCDALGFRCNLSWRPRDSNQEADRITKHVFEGFDENLRLPFSWSEMTLSVLPSLLRFASFQSELDTIKASIADDDKLSSSNKGMAQEGVRRLHDWLRHQSRHEGDDELERWVPASAPPAKSRSWAPVYSHGVILRWEKAMAPEAAAETSANWSKHLETTTDRWQRSIEFTCPASESTSGSAGSGGVDPDRREAVSAASGGVDPDVRMTPVGKTESASMDAPRAAPAKRQITLQQAEMARGDLVGRWRIVGAVRKKGSSYRDVVSSDFHRQFPDLFQASCVDLKSKLNSVYWFLHVSAQSEEPPCQEWLRRRELDHVVEEFARETNFPRERFRFYRLADSMLKVTPGPTWKQAFHGTWMYGVWSTLAAGQGSYWRPRTKTRAMFADGSYCRAIFELMVDFDQLTAKRNKGGVQWVSKPEGVAVLGVWLLVNAPPSKGDEFMEAWDPVLEVRPENKPAVAAVVNERQMVGDETLKGCRAWETCAKPPKALLDGVSGVAGGIDPATSGVAEGIDPATSAIAGGIDPVTSGFAGGIEPATYAGVPPPWLDIEPAADDDVPEVPTKIVEIVSYGMNYQRVDGADIYVDLRDLRTPDYDHRASQHLGNRPPKRPSGLDTETRMAVASSLEAQRIFSAVLDHIDSIRAERTDEAATALCSSHALPLWSRKEWALASFFRECNRRGQSVLDPAASDTGGFDPVSRRPIEGRTYRLVDNVQQAVAGEFIAHLLEVKMLADQVKTLQELKLLYLDRRQERMELRGILPLQPGSFQTEYILYESIDCLHWVDHYVATEYYFRCTGRCSRRPCAAGGACVTWLFIIITFLRLCFFTLAAV
ncbi:unnamed protein product [Symbiodinium sp. CCMP2592]|nr:unnamed protein product [Symbiodinium sp. CCMP2592]